MKLVIAGFTWAIPGSVSTERFCEILTTMNRKRFKFKGHQRVILIGKRDGYLVGAVLTKKTNKKFTTMEIANYKVHVRTFSKDRPGVDFNLFILNPTLHGQVMHGLYMYYHQTMKTRSFNKFMSGRFKKS